MNNVTYLVIVGIAVMLLMVISILLAVLFNQRKKNQHREAMEKLREQQQNQLIEAAVRSEETERHRIAETLHAAALVFLTFCCTIGKIWPREGIGSDTRNSVTRKGETCDTAVHDMLPSVISRNAFPCIF